MDITLENVLSNAALLVFGAWALAWAAVSSIEKVRAKNGAGPDLDTLPERKGWRVHNPEAYDRIVPEMPPRRYGLFDQILSDVRSPGTLVFLSAMLGLSCVGAAYMDGWSLLAGLAIGGYWLWQIPKMVRLVRYGLVREGEVLDLRGPTFFSSGVADVSVKDGAGPITVVVPWRHCRRLLDEGEGARVLVVFHPDRRDDNLGLAIRPKK